MTNEMKDANHEAAMEEEEEGEEEEEEEEEEEDGDESMESSSDDDSDDMEDGGEEFIAQLEGRLDACGKRDYEAFHQLLRIYKKKSMRKQLEKTREQFSNSFPLAEGKF